MAWITGLPDEIASRAPNGALGTHFGRRHRPEPDVTEQSEEISRSAVTSGPLARLGCMEHTEHPELVRLGAQYLRAYAEGDAVNLYRLADAWGASDLIAATCEVALAIIHATSGPQGLDAVSTTFATTRR
ncbi:hypothetical protein [Promicromonospora sp. NPDC090134]|uniref:hypothetical protein n=2 Tax=unclassified Promicromonospora TaxID=2647929 RepID=UPI0038300DF8